MFIALRDNTSNRTTSFRPWGIWPTVGFSLIIIAAFLLAQILASSVLVAIALRQDPALDIDVYSRSLESNGLLLAIATCAGTSDCASPLDAPCKDAK